MTAEPTDPRRQAWSAYWARGPLHSCTGSFDARYSGAIGTFWDAVTSALSPGDRVLDLATGNGALPLRLWEAFDGVGPLHVDAVDLATVAPPWYRADTHRGIAFHPGVAMEALPFADDTFDCVASQFGLEYARRPDALVEALRVARRDARMAFVMHHAGSVLVSVARAEVANHAQLMAADGLLAATRQALPWVAAARSATRPGTDPRAAAARAAYNAAMARTAQAIATEAVPDALVEAREWLHRLVAGVDEGTLPAAIDALDAYREDMRAASLRSAELLEHALDADAIAGMATVLRAARPGSTVDYSPLVQREGVLAWGLVLSPPGDSRTASKGPRPSA